MDKSNRIKQLERLNTALAAKLERITRTDKASLAEKAKYKKERIDVLAELLELIQ